MKAVKFLNAKMWLVLAVFGVLLFGALYLGALPAEKGSAEIEQARVVRVVDGDTLAVDRGHGEEKVRLIGIDAPESVHPDAERNSVEGQEASAHLKGLIKDGAIVYLERDVSETDKYGRLLRYVWISDPAAKPDPAEAMLNAKLVAEGFARPVDYEPDTSYSSLFHSLAGE